MKVCQEEVLVLVLQPRKKRSLQLLRSEANLYPDPSVPPISIPRAKMQRKIRTKMAGSYEDSSDSEHEHRSHQEIRRERARLLNSIRRRRARKIGEHIKSRELQDVWEEGSAVVAQ